MTPSFSPHPEAVHLAGRWLNELSEAGKLHIPTGNMLDFAFGGLDEELLHRLHGDHLSVCPECSEAVEVYRRERPTDPARLFEVPEFAASRYRAETYPLSPEEAGQRLRTFLARGAEALWIVAGEANPLVYNNATAEVLEKRAERSARSGHPLPQVLCGPVMGLMSADDDPADAPLPRLARAGAVRLLVAERRQKFHFRATADGRVHTEEYHRAGAPGERRGYWYRSRPIAALLQRRFEALLASGIAQPAVDHHDFKCLPMSRLAEIDRASGGRFDELRACELSAYLA